MPHRLDDTDGGLLATFVVASTLVLALLVASVIGSSLDVANGPSVGAIDLGRERRAPAPSAAAPPAPPASEVAAAAPPATGRTARTTARTTVRTTPRRTASAPAVVALTPATATLASAVRPSATSPSANEPATTVATAGPTRSLASVSSVDTTTKAPDVKTATGNGPADNAAVRGTRQVVRTNGHSGHGVDRPRRGALAPPSASPSGHHGRGRTHS